MSLDTTAATSLADHPVVADLASTFHQAGHQLYLVGGSVRDALLGDVVDDLDFTTDARPDVIRDLVEPLGPIWDAGADYGTIGVVIGGEKVEITTFRSEQYHTDSRKPEVDFSGDVADDLSRRDLTINAIALDVIGRRVVDPHGGVADLSRGVLRTPGDAEVCFTEDPLRQVRVVRFAARFDFEIDHELRRAIAALRDRLAIVARERITAELRKVLGGGPATTARAVVLADELGITAALFGRLVGDVATATQRLTQAEPDTDALAVLAFGQHDAAAALRAIKLSGDEIACSTQRATVAEQLTQLDTGDATAVRQLARELLSEPSGHRLVEDAAQVARAAGHDTDLAVGALLGVVRDEPQVVAPLPIDGHDLLDAGLQGPRIGAGLRQATDALLGAGSLTREQALAAALAD